MNDHYLPLLLSTLLSTLLPAQSPVELGDVRWGRDFDAALRQAEAKGKPVFLLFQEVPGCATCRNYGQNVLTHPLIVEAIEELFVPVAIYNNKDGKDAAVLKRYREPKCYLSKAVYRYVPMTPLQAARANALVGEGRSPDSVLSPRQIVLKSYIEANPEMEWGNRIGADWKVGWRMVWERMR